MKKKPSPKFFKRTSKLPTKSELKTMKDKVLALSGKHNPDEQLLYEVKPMTEKKKTTKDKGTRTKKTLTPEQVSILIEQWNDKTMTEFSNEFDVSLQVVSNMVKAIRKEDASLCPPRTKRTDIAKAGIALFKKKQGKK